MNTRNSKIRAIARDTLRLAREMLHYRDRLLQCANELLPFVRKSDSAYPTLAALQLEMARTDAVLDRVQLLIDAAILAKDCGLADQQATETAVFSGPISQLFDRAAMAEWHEMIAQLRVPARYIYPDAPAASTCLPPTPGMFGCRCVDCVAADKLHDPLDAPIRPLSTVCIDDLHNHATRPRVITADDMAAWLPPAPLYLTEYFPVTNELLAEDDIRKAHHGKAT